MAEQTDRFVLFNFTCSCGTDLQVHGEYYVGPRSGFEFVYCPSCKKEHELPTKPLRFFFKEKDKDYWVSVAVSR